MMRKGFSLLELLVVIGIMGLLGTVSISSYRSVVRGMEERGALQNATQFVHAAFQRAMIDRLPTAVYFWNETVRASTDDENEIVVGKAVAVRRGGRITRVSKDYLFDEFGDLNRSYATNSTGQGSSMYLYQLGGSNEGLKRSLVYDTVHYESHKDTFLLDPADGGEEDWEDLRMTGSKPSAGIEMFAFIVKDLNGVDWAVGDAYGFEFQTLELPKNFIFGSNYSSNTGNPVVHVGEMIFGYGAGGYDSRNSNASGMRTIQISALRPDSSGNLTPVNVGKTADPTKEQN